jgi:hypothetical protein
VLPPRTSVTCAAPSADAAAYGQGLFDVTTTLGAHGSYLADLRVSVPGADVRVDGVRVAFSLPDASDVDAADFDGDVLTGDVVLHGEKNDLRVGVIENVELHCCHAATIAMRPRYRAGHERISRPFPGQRGRSGGVLGPSR